jgi:hypothetical protein
MKTLATALTLLALALAVTGGCTQPTTTPQASSSPAPTGSSPSGDLVETKLAGDLAKEFKDNPERAKRLYMDPEGGHRPPGKVLVAVSGVVAKVDGNDVHLNTGADLPVVVLRAKSLPQNRTKAASGKAAFVKSYDSKTIVIETEVEFVP